MPKKNQQGKPNGYILYAQEIRNQLLQEGHSIRNTNDLISAAAPKWEALQANEREYYKEKAKWEWENRHEIGLDNRARCNRRDNSGTLISERVDTVTFNEDRRKRERIEVFASFPKGNAVYEKKFYFVSFICLLEEPEYQAVEVAAIEFSLLNGIERSWHKFIKPGPIPIGYRFVAQQTSDASHQIPVQGIANPDDTYTRIYDELYHFLSRGKELIPPIHVRRSECDRTEGCLKWLARNAGRPNNLRRIYELEGLILDLDSHLADEPQTFSQSKKVATDIIATTIFDFDSGTRCPWHEEKDAQVCALGSVRIWSYGISETFCANFNIPITDNHLPKKRNEVCYTLIPSNADSKASSRYHSRVASRAERNDGMYQYGHEDIAHRVAEQLKVEARQRQLEEDDEKEYELKRQQKVSDQKKKWAQYRPVQSQEVINITEDVKNVKLDQVPAPTTKPRYVTPVSVKPSIGRGRGRGTMIANLRRPGESGPNSTTAASQSTSNRALTDGCIRPPPGFARGANRLMQFNEVHNSNINGKQLYAGSKQAPHASDAPVPPSEWVT